MAAAKRTAAGEGGDVASLVRQVLSGDLEAVAPLYDRLAEAGDPRAAEALGLAVDLRDDWEERAVEDASRRWRSAEERAFRMAEVRYLVWSGFADELRGLFRIELEGVPPLGFLKGLAAALEAPRQAVRLGEEEAVLLADGASEEEKPNEFVSDLRERRRHRNAMARRPPGRL